MKKVLITLGVIAVIIFAIASVFIGKYNGIVASQQNVKASWGNVESTLQRRADLIPNLVATVKGYATHEQDTFEAVTKARADAMKTTVNVDLTDPKAMQQLVSMQGELGGALSKLMAVSERYPDLKASQNFLDLQSQLEGTENRINVARTRYNEAARGFNSMVLSFFGNIVNSMFLHYKEFQYFQAEKGAESAPKVQF